MKNFFYFISVYLGSGVLGGGAHIQRERERERQTAGRSTSVGMRLQKFPLYSWTWIPCPHGNV